MIVQLVHRPEGASPAKRISAMAELYPPVEPYEMGMLDAGDGNKLGWRTCGPSGEPAVMAHGAQGRAARRTCAAAQTHDQRSCARGSMALRRRAASSLSMRRKVVLTRSIVSGSSTIPSSVWLHASRRCCRFSRARAVG